VDPWAELTMPVPILTLTTDFGEDSPYVAAMKGVILALNPAVQLIDLSHQIPPQSVQHAAFFLAHSIPYFPIEALHVVVVDPGVGSERAILYLEVNGHRLLAPDNGCWTLLAGKASRVIQVAEPRFWRQPVSRTFHGRDIFAPVAARLSLGLDPTELGPPVRDRVRLSKSYPQPFLGGIRGEVAFVDHFGNIITNIPADDLASPVGALAVGDRNYPQIINVKTYGDAEPGCLVVLASSAGLVEIAVVHGHAASRLNASIGTPVVFEFASSSP
jgi:S-adenosylmethionine hydrolase